MDRVSFSGFTAVQKRAMMRVVPFIPEVISHLSVIAVSDTEMRRLNCQYRKINKTTDILTFIYDKHRADIYMSLSVANRQAIKRGVTLSQECQRLLVHGIFHAAGMDHHTESDFQTMRRKEFETLIQCVVMRQ